MHIMAGRIRELIRSHPLAIMLLLAGSAGFILGLSNATWQVTVETAQVLAGIVNYPPDNPFYFYHIKVFTIINHISALLLAAGVPEKTLSVLISGLLGMVSFQAIATLIYALNRNVPISVLGVVLVYFAKYVGDGVIYTIWLLGQPHTYGILGLSFAVLAVALLAAGACRAGLFCLGLAPAVHPSVGTWVFFIVTLSALIEPGLVKKALRAHYPYLLAGLLVAACSAAYQLHLMQALPTIDPQIKEKFLDAYLRYWDSHRRPMFWCTGLPNYHIPCGLLYCGYSILLALCCLKIFREKRTLALLFRAILLSGVLSLSLGLLTQLPQEKIPSFLLILMPGRYINFNNIVLVPCLLGVLTCPPHRAYVANYNFFLLFLVGSFFARHDEAQAVTFALMLSWIAFLAAKKYGWRPTYQPQLRQHKPGYATLMAVFLVAFLAMNLPREDYRRHFIFNPQDMNDRTNSSFYRAIAERPGLLLTTHYAGRIQLKTRRPILFDMASPNCFAYAPESAETFDRILRQIYGIDLLRPPPEGFQHYEILPQLYRDLWERRTVSGWQQIREKFAVTDVLTPADWRLSLPVVAEGEGMILYEIPER